VPDVEMAHRETPSPDNPAGLKGVGEAGCIATGALFAQAVEDALAGAIEICEIPLSPNRLFELMEQGSEVRKGPRGSGEVRGGPKRSGRVRSESGAS